ncbi:MAG: MarR family transcriptional regulator [Natronospirillum sp.]|uniref:MarR family winged helix-turn-helix transcriptional regulator n=1 Tax=Natronospirillum sp. TaxID=2812955 RepID=UPI0025CE9E5B|nr:MarR family transcriptional regulator [Natronospirillum sp.]MCH8552274.1 MarR family transcriptional regulator [Natronospirillum sp.]
MEEEATKNKFGYHIWLLNRLAQTRFSKVLAPLSIGPGQQVYLLALQPGETINQDTLAHRLRVDRSNVTRALTALVAQGYIHRERSAQDGRQWLITLTEQGTEARRLVISHASAWVDDLKAPLNEDEWQQLTTLLARVCQHQVAPD